MPKFALATKKKERRAPTCEGRRQSMIYIANQNSKNLSFGIIFLYVKKKKSIYLNNAYKEVHQSAHCVQQPLRLFKERKNKKESLSLLEAQLPYKINHSQRMIYILFVHPNLTQKYGYKIIFDCLVQQMPSYSTS